MVFLIIELIPGASWLVLSQCLKYGGITIQMGSDESKVGSDNWGVMMVVTYNMNGVCRSADQTNIEWPTSESECILIRCLILHVSQQIF